MAVNSGNIKKQFSPNHIASMSFDEEFQVNVVELLGYDPLTGTNGGLKRITTHALGEYQVNDMEEIGSVTYIGKEDIAGDWYIQKVDETSGTSIRYATTRNNVSYTTYSDAWDDRASLTYGTYSTAF